MRLKFKGLRAGIICWGTGYWVDQVEWRATGMSKDWFRIACMWLWNCLGLSMTCHHYQNLRTFLAQWQSTWPLPPLFCCRWPDYHLVCRCSKPSLFQAVSDGFNPRTIEQYFAAYSYHPYRLKYGDGSPFWPPWLDISWCKFVFAWTDLNRHGLF